MTDTRKTGSSEETQRHDIIDRLDKTLEQWRGRIDELIVQADLASKGVRDEMHARLQTAENAYLAARSRLARGRDDMGEDVSSLRHDVERLLGDVKRAFEKSQHAAREVVSR
jgi:hypothetical protein